MHIHVIRKRDKGPTAQAIDPTQQPIVNVAGRLPTGNVDEPEIGKDLIRQGPSERSTNEGIADIPVEILVTDEAALKTRLPADPERIGYEAAGGIARMSEDLGKRREFCIKVRTERMTSAVLVHATAR
jgi:hypothetical protein